MVPLGNPEQSHTFSFSDYFVCIESIILLFCESIFEKNVQLFLKWYVSMV